MMDPRFDAARATDQSGDRGWDFRPDDREPTRAPIFLAVVAIMVVGMAFMGAIV